MEERLNQLTIGTSLLIGLVLAGIYYFTMYNDGSGIENQIATAQQEVQKTRVEVEKVRKVLEEASRYQQTMATLGAEMDKVVRAIPSELNSLDLMKSISTEAKGVGAEINNLSSNQSSYNSRSSTEEKSFYQIVPIEVDLTGTYNQIMLFLSNLTKIDKIITAQKLTMAISQRGSGATGSVPIINMKASFQAYKYQPPKTEESSSGSTPGGNGEE